MKDDEATSSWLSAVDIEAAMIAERSSPAMNGGNSLRASAMKTIFCCPSGSSSSATSIRPRYAITSTAPSDKITQTMATAADFFTIEDFLIDMKRTRMCGMPK